MIFLDTHVVVWLYARLFDKISPTAHRIINENDLFISPMVRLELKYLHEIGRITEKEDPIVATLHQEMGLRVHTIDFDQLISAGIKNEWTRDPFDRLIVAHAQLEDVALCSRDQTILAHYDKAVW